MGGSEHRLGLGGLRALGALRAASTLCAASALVLSLGGCPSEPEGPGCGGDTVQDGATGECVPVRCGVGPWPAFDGDAVHVAPSGSPGALGDASSPLDSIQDAVRAAGPGGAVLIAAGTYRENLRIEGDQDGVTLLGRCAEMVTIDGDDDAPVIWVQDGAATLERVTLTGSSEGGLHVQRPSPTDSPAVTVQNVVVRGVGGVGVTVVGASSELTATGLSIVEMSEDDGVRGGGLMVEGGTLRATDLRIDQAGEWGLVAFGGDVEVEGAVISDVTPRADGLRGRGVSIREGARASLVDVAISQVGEAGLVVSSDAVVDVAGLSVLEAVGTADGSAGFGVAVISGGSLSLSGADIQGTVASAFAAQGEGSVLTVTDSVARGNVGGFTAEGGADASLDGVLFEDNTRSGVSVYSASVSVVDTIVRRTRVGDGAATAVGVSLFESTLIAERLTIEDTEAVGLSILDGSTATVTDSSITGSHSPDPAERPVGVRIARESALTATRVLLDGNEAVGLEVSMGSVELIDCTITDTRTFDGGQYGRALSVFGGADLVADGLTIEEGHDVAVLVAQPGTTALLLDSRIALTRTSTSASPGGAIAVQDGAQVTLRDTLVEANEGAGVYVAGASATVLDSTLDANGFAGAVCLGGSLLIEGSVVSGSRPDPSHGGGIGVFSQGLAGRCALTVRDTEFLGLPGPALYLRGPGATLLERSVVRECGAPPSMAGLVALGVPSPAQDDGLVVQGSTFEGIPTDAILLDASGIELRADPESGANVFTDVAGQLLFRQRCGPDADVLDGSAADPSCQPAPRPMGPSLEYPIRLVEVDPVP